MGIGFVLSRSMAGDPIQREPNAAEARDSTAGPHLDLNRATRGELALLPGVGPARAQSIDDYRAQHGDFGSIDDLRKVPGIGPKTLERLRSSLFVGPIAQTKATQTPERPPAAGRGVTTSSGKSKKETALSAAIEVNQADAATLQKLPGIGPKLSQRIVDERTLRGPFKAVNELRRVPGIGPKTLEKLRPHVVVEHRPPKTGF
jgi:competence protein ComEA